MAAVSPPVFLMFAGVFSARLYGSRSHKNKKIVEELKEVAKQL
jgi:predicted site-specific integrase-resolvase